VPAQWVAVGGERPAGHIGGRNLHHGLGLGRSRPVGRDLGHYAIAQPETSRWRTPGRLIPSGKASVAHTI
jgi:hypothetical protein